jgi:hypothetical protein
MKKLVAIITIVFACAFMFGCMGPDVKTVEGTVVAIEYQAKGTPEEGVTIVFDNGKKVVLRGGGAEDQLVVGELNHIKIYKSGEKANMIYKVQIK